MYLFPHGRILENKKYIYSGLERFQKSFKIQKFDQQCCRLFPGGYLGYMLAEHIKSITIFFVINALKTCYRVSKGCYIKEIAFS